MAGGSLAGYGPAIPALRQTFQLDAAGAGLLLSAHVAGGLTALALWTATHRRVPARAALTVAAISMSAGCLGLALSTVWTLSLASGVLIGFGFGGFAVALNSLFADGYGERSGFMINLLNGAYGVGAILAPLAIGALPDADYRVPYAALAAMALLTMPLLWDMPDPNRRAGADLATSLRPDPRTVRRLLIGFGLVYVVYSGVEQGIGLWEATHLVSQSFSRSAAASYTALFFTAFTLGRFIVAPIALRVSADRIFIGCISLTIVFLLLAQIGPTAPVAYALAGLACGPVFPTGLNWLVRSLPGVRSAAAVVLAGGGLGGAIFPAMIGRLIDITGYHRIPLLLAALAAMALLGALSLRRVVDQSRPRPAPQPAAP